MYDLLTGNLSRFGLVFTGLLALVACGGVDDVSINNAPTAINVQIIDDNGGEIEPGDALTGQYDYNDTEGDLEGTSTYRWLRDGKPIAGATAVSYTLVNADNDSIISFEVTPVAATGTTTGEPVVSGGISVANNAPQARNVRITDTNGGDTVVGDTLVGSYVYSDKEGDPEGDTRLQWYRNNNAISGATSDSYTLVAADSGRTISLKVTPMALSGVSNGKAAVSNTLFVVNSAPYIGAVSIIDKNGGAPQVRDLLRGDYIFKDIDNDIEGASIYRWLRNGNAIPGATAKDYTLVAEDSGEIITFEVTPVAATGRLFGSPAVSGAAVIENSPPTASNVSITDTNGGTTVVGDTLMASYTYNDVDEDAEGSSLYRWLRNGSEITGATGISYTLVAADSGTTISFEVTPVAGAGTTDGIPVLSANSLNVINSAPVAVNVSISDSNGGDPVVGDTLDGNYTFTDVDNDAEGTSTFRWLRNGVAIAGATTTSYTLTAADSGTNIRFEVTPVASTGVAAGSAVRSALVSVVNSAPTASAVTITDVNGGDPVVGDVLEGSYTYNDIDNNAEGSSTFVWRRNGIAIAGATSITYTLVAADSGQTISFDVTPVASAGASPGATVSSDNTINVVNSVPVASAPAITDVNGGSIVVGDILSGSYAYSDIDIDPEGASSFRWLRNGVAISGATAIDYTLVAADSGQQISFEVTPVALAGASPGVAVQSLPVTVINSAPTAESLAITDANGGSIVVGDRLDGSYLFNDIDNDPEGASTFRWLRNGVAIAGATATSYTLTAADSGTNIRFEVTPVASSGMPVGSPVLSSAVTVINSVPVASAVTISDDNGGSIVVGDSLTGNYSYNDIDADNEGVSIFRWLRNGLPIAGATASTYTLAVADSGQEISFEVTPVASSGASPGIAVVSSPVTVINSAPVASAVSVTDENGGSVVVGDQLDGSYSYSDIDGDPEGGTTFRWLRSGTAIAGATSASYILTAADSGQDISFEVTPVAVSGATTGTAQVSSPLTVVNSAPVATAVSIIDNNGGNVEQGDTLTGSYIYSDPDGDLEGTSTYRWLRNGSEITGATNINYTLVVADNGQSISFEVTPIAASGVIQGNAVVSGALVATNSAPVASNVTITDDNGGTVVVGDTLSGNYSYSDANNDPEGISTFRWLRNGAAISGATASSYTLVAADSGQTISFEVTPVASSGTTTGAAVSSAGVVVLNSAPTVSNVTISDPNGNGVIVGDQLSGSYDYNDIDGDAQGSSSFQWLRDGLAIPGATTTTYTLVPADSGREITFRVTPVAASGVTTGQAVVSSGVTVLNSAPVASLVSITDNNAGDPLVGDTLTGSYSYSDIDGDLEGVSTFRWLRNGAAISGATATSYVLVAADSGQVISFEVTPVAASGNPTGSAVVSAPITVINSAPVASAVSITDGNGGNALVGDVLSGSYTYFDADNDAEGSSSYQWLRNGSAIAGATGLDYTLVAADSGQDISFRVTPVAASGLINGLSVTSQTVTIQNSAPVASSVSISDPNGGSIIVGDSLTGSYSYSDADNDAEGSSTFRWLRNGSAIAGATSATYTVAAADSGAQISFEVTPVATAGVLTGTASVSAEVSVINSAPTASNVSISDDNGGDALVGDVLSGSYSYADIDNDPEGATAFRWMRNGIAISGASQASYTLVAADSGQSISLEVTPVAASGTSPGAPVVSANSITVVNSAPVASNVTIADNNGGNIVVGVTLSGSYTYSDPDNDPEGVSLFRWLRNGAPISGATASSYTLVAADSGQSISLEVTPVALSGITTGSPVLSSTALTVINSAPVASNVSVLDGNGGDALVGDLLTGSYTYSDIDGDLEGSSNFQWLRNGVAIAGANTTSYTLVSADSGQLISFEVTPVATSGTTTGQTVTSANSLSVINSAPVASAVAITDANGGDPVVGDVLNGSYSYFDADGDSQGSSTFRWLRNGSPIAGATAQSYTLIAADSGADIVFEVTPVAATGVSQGVATASAALTVVNSAPLAANVSISDSNGGDTVVGDTLVVSYDYSDIDGDLEGTSIFRWLRNGTGISGANGNSYILVAADSGQSISVEVTPVAATGTTTGSPVLSGNSINVINSAPVASAVTISDPNGGSIVVGDTLNGNYSYSDIDNDAEGVSTFRWLRNGTAISGATSTTYTLTSADSGTAISFEVTPVAATGIVTGTTVISAAVNVLNSAPVASNVSITDSNGGSTVVGDTLTASYSYTDIDGDSEGSSLYRWLRDGVAISGATTTSYTLVAADSGTTVSFEVTPIAATGTTTGIAVTSANSLSVVNSAPVASAVSINDANGGQAVVGDVLTGVYTYSDADGDGEGASTFQWLRNGSVITGATSQSYTLTSADSGQSISFAVTPVATAGVLTGTTVTSGSIVIENTAPVATNVTITDTNGGSVVVGDTLDGAYTYTDVDNDPEGTSTFRWLRGGTAIAGATSSSYTLVAADSGQAISFEVTPVAASGTTTGSPVVSSTLSVVNSAPVATAVGITDSNGGDIVVGDVLTGSYTYSDADNDGEGTSTFRWLRGGTAIAGATASSYTLVAADSGQDIVFEVTPVAATGTTTGSAVASAAVTVINSAPVASNVAISDGNGGSIVVGDVLTGNYSYSDADNDAEGSSLFRWLRDGTAIAGATTASYTLVAADSGANITFEVTPVASTGTTTGSAVSSSAVTVINSAPVAAAVTISDDNGGSAVVGDSLTGSYSYSDADGDPEGVSTFRWLRDGVAIAGATSSTYVLVAADSGAAIRFEVTPVATAGVTTGSPVASASLAIINSAPVATAVSITDDNGGAPLVGDTLSGVYTYSDPDGDPEGTSSYRWLRDGTAIAGATALTYTLVAADSGADISFEVTPVASTGTTTGTAVASTAITVLNSAPVASAVTVTDTNGGSVVVGDTLDGSYTYTDADNDAEGSSSFRWLRDGVAISGATASSYTLVADDSGSSISFEVTPVATSGTLTGTPVVSTGVTVVNSAPVASAVTITDGNGGSVVVGDTLDGSYTYSDVDNDPEGTTTFRWLRDGVAISGATAASYTLVAADSGTAISFEVTPVAGSGITTGTPVPSAAVNVINSAPVATAVTITDTNGGSVVVGDTLDGSYTYSDIDNDPEGTTTFRWLRDGAAISGATAASYTLVAADSGATITFEVTPVASSGTTTGQPVVSAGLAVVNSAPLASAVIVTDSNGGSVVVGDTLDGSYTYSDADNDPEGTSTFRWLRDGAAISGATAASYTLVAADSGTTISFEVTPVASSGVTTGTPAVSSGLVVVNSAPVASAVTITDANGGSALVGDVLNGSYAYSDVDNDPEGTTTFRWLRDGVAITGATAASYTLDAADSGATITFEVTPVATTGVITGSAVSSAGLAVDNSAPVASSVSITDNNGGATVVGDTLTGNYTYSDIDGDVEGSSTFRWLRDGVAISGATTTNYTLVAADSGTAISFEVTPVASTGTTTGTPVASTALTVDNSAPTATAVSITDDNGGNVVVGDSLTGSYTYDDIDGDAEGTTTFRWLRNGVAIAGATASTYTVAAADSGQALSFEVTPVAQTGTLTGLPVESATVSVINSPPVASNVGISDNNGGNIVVGTVLTGSYDYADVDGDLEGVSTYRWLRDGVAITGATTLSYTLVADDSGALISFEVTPVADTGTTTGTAVESAAVSVLNSAPTASNLAISDNNGGSIVVGVVLTGSYTYTDIDGDLEGTSTFRWLRGGVEIAGATASSYTLVAADSGQDISFEVTPVAATGITTGTPVVSTTVTVLNSAPVASSVTITDGNGGFAVAGDTLSGSYAYSDIDNDPEGTTSFRWLRDGVAIAGATSIDYTLVAADIATRITLEVTPVAQTGVLTGQAVLSNVIATGTAPVVSGYARYLDTNTNGINDAGDQLIVGFDQDINLNAVSSSDLALPVSGDAFGGGATVAAGPAGNELTVTLGSSPVFITAGDFSSGTTSAGSASGVDIAAGMLPDAIESLSGVDATPSTAADLIPAFVDSQQALSSNDSRAVALGDVDGDGDLDMVVANISSQPNTVWLNDGAGNFTDSGQTLGTGNSRSVALGDIDSDGDLDMVVANDGAGNTVWTNDGSGTFADSGQSLGTGASQAVALADVDGDNDLDMVVANLGQGNTVWTNDGAGAFTDSTQSLGANDSVAIVMGDIDADNDLDMIVANTGTTNANRVYTNNGSGVFTDSGQTLGSSASQGIDLGDVDGDGDLDIVVANDGAANRVWLNDASGVFSDSTQTLGANASLSVILADIDGDNDLDMLVANQSAANRVWLNDGAGNFSDSGQLLGSGYSTAIAAGDVDGDSDTDMVVTNFAEPNRVYLDSLAGTQ